MSVRTRRVYESPGAGEGRRYLVERLWPRGIGKEKLGLTEWLKDLAPSPALRTWYAHDVQKFPAFRLRYWKELESHGDLVDRLVREAREGPITLLYAARDSAHCSASILREFIEKRLGE
jgi:uncharacterized protein YeaO (DUF488 family)